MSVPNRPDVFAELTRLKGVQAPLEYFDLYANLRAVLQKFNRVDPAGQPYSVELFGDGSGQIVTGNSSDRISVVEWGSYAMGVRDRDRVEKALCVVANMERGNWPESLRAKRYQDDLYMVGAQFEYLIKQGKVAHYIVNFADGSIRFVPSPPVRRIDFGYDETGRLHGTIE